MSLCPVDYSWGFCLNTPTLVRSRQYRALVIESFLTGLISTGLHGLSNSFTLNHWHLSTIQINNLHLYLGTPPPPQKPYKPWRVESLETALSLLQHLWPAFEGRQLSCDPLSQSHTEGMVIGWQLLWWTRGRLPQAPVWWWPWNKRQHWVNTRRGGSLVLQDGFMRKEKYCFNSP